MPDRRTMSGQGRHHRSDQDAGQDQLQGIGGHVVAPGFVETDMTMNWRAGADRSREADSARRIGTPEDIAHGRISGIRGGGYVTGQVLTVDVDCC